MAGVMVDFGPPITHLPPPAVGASPDAAIYDFEGSCRRSSQCGGGAGAGAAEDEDGRGGPGRALGGSVSVSIL